MRRVLAVFMVLSVIGLIGIGSFGVYAWASSLGDGVQGAKNAAFSARDKGADLGRDLSYLREAVAKDKEEIASLRRELAQAEMKVSSMMNEAADPKRQLSGVRDDYRAVADRVVQVERQLSSLENLSFSAASGKLWGAERLLKDGLTTEARVMAYEAIMDLALIRRATCTKGEFTIRNNDGFPDLVREAFFRGRSGPTPPYIITAEREDGWIRLQRTGVSQGC